ncbi:unnamed protein product [Ectocarpus sp. CCAP 1310/34]|nr:unnamed protein product [Ectocarpus sp. CCAP 1310/34]
MTLLHRVNVNELPRNHLKAETGDAGREVNRIQTVSREKEERHHIRHEHTGEGNRGVLRVPMTERPGTGTLEEAWNLAPRGTEASTLVPVPDAECARVRVHGCGDQHSRRDSLEAAVQADPGLQLRAERLIRGLNDEPHGARPLYIWNQDSPGIGPALDDVSMDDLSLRFQTVKKVQPRFASDHARLQTHVLHLVNKQLAEGGGASSATGTPLSTIRVIKLWYLLPGILHSFDGRIARKKRYNSLKRGDISSVLPWLIEYTKAASARSRGPAREDTPDDKFKRAARACRHSGGVKDAARALLADQPSPGNDETWARLKAKFPHEDPVQVEQAIAEAIAASRTEEEEGSAPRWRPETELDPQVLLQVINSRSSNSGAGNDGQRFSHLMSIVNTKIGREEFSNAMSSLWRRLINDPNAFPPEFWTLWKQSSLIALGEKCRPVCIGMTWRRLIAAGTVREWKPKLEEIFREADQFGVAVAGGVEQVAMDAQLVHQTGHWVVQTDCSNAFNTGKRTAIMAQAAKSVPDLVGYIARCYDEIPAKAIYTMDSGERRTIECKSGVQQGDGMGPPLFCFILVPIVLKLRAKYDHLGVCLKAYMDDISLHFKNITAENIQVIPDLVDELEAVGIIVNRGKSSALPPPGHDVTPAERRLLGDAGLPIAEEGITVVGVPIGTDAYVEDIAMKVITEGGADKLARMLVRMPDKQVAHLVTSQSLTQRSGYIERGINHKLVKGACKRLDNMVMWVLEATMGLRDTEVEEEFFQDDCQPDRFKLKPYQQAQARLSTGAGGLGLPAAVMRRFSASLGNLVGTLPAVIAALRGPLGESVRVRIPGTVLVERMGDAIKELNQEHAISVEILKGILPPSWVEWALEPTGETGRRQPTVAELAAHDGESTTPRKAQHKLGKAINKIQLEKFMESLEHLPQEAVPPTRDNPYGGQEARNMAYARTRSSQGQGGHAFLRAAPTDRAREIPSNEFVYATRRALGVEEFLAERCPRCHRGREGEIITTVHARTCRRDGAQVNMHEPLKYALSRALNGLRVKHDVESGAPFTGERNLSMDIVIRPGALTNASSPGYRNKGILLDVTHADPQAQVHLRNGSATSDGIAAQASEARKRQHYARPGHVSFDERSFKLTTLAVESFGRLGEEGYEFIDELATHAVGGRDGGTMALKGVFKERLLQIVSVATQVAISRRVQRYKLAFRGRQDAENRRTRSTSDQSTPMIWGWSVDAS